MCVSLAHREMSSPEDVLGLAKVIGSLTRVLTNPSGSRRSRTSCSDIANGGPVVCVPIGKMSITAERTVNAIATHSGTVGPLTQFPAWHEKLKHAMGPDLPLVGAQCAQKCAVVYQVKAELAEIYSEEVSNNDRRPLLLA